MNKDAFREALSLLQRRAIIRHALKGCSPAERIHADRELRRILERLSQLPDALQVISQAAAELDRAAETLTVREVARRCAPPGPPPRGLRVSGIESSTQSREVVGSP